MEVVKTPNLAHQITEEIELYTYLLSVPTLTIEDIFDDLSEIGLSDSSNAKTGAIVLEITKLCPVNKSLPIKDTSYIEEITKTNLLQSDSVQDTISIRGHDSIIWDDQLAGELIIEICRVQPNDSKSLLTKYLNTSFCESPLNPLQVTRTVFIVYLEFYIHIDLNDVFSFFRKGYRSFFFNELERLINIRSILYFDHKIMQAMIEYYTSRKLFDRLESVLVALDASKLNINYFLRLAMKTRMVNAIVHFSGYKLDYLIPIIWLLSDANVTSQECEVVFQHIRHCVCPQIPEICQIKAQVDVLSLLCSHYLPAFIAQPHGFIEKKTQYQIMHLLIIRNLKGMLRIIELILASPAFIGVMELKHIDCINDDYKVIFTKSKILLVDCTFMFHALLRLRASTGWAHDELLNFDISLATIYGEHKLTVAKQDILDLYLRLLDISNGDFHSERESGLIAIFNTGLLPPCDADSLANYNKLQFFSLYRKKAITTFEYALLIKSYALPSGKDNVFDDINTCMSDISEYGEHILKESCLTNINLLATIDIGRFVHLFVFKWPGLYNEVLDLLDSRKLKFEYMDGMIGSFYDFKCNHLLYIDLLCEFRPEDVHAYMDTADDVLIGPPFDLEAANLIFVAHKCLRGIIWILLKKHEFKGGLELCLSHIGGSDLTCSKNFDYFQLALEVCRFADSYFIPSKDSFSMWIKTVSVSISNAKLVSNPLFYSTIVSRVPSLIMARIVSILIAEDKLDSLAFIKSYKDVIQRLEIVEKIVTTINMEENRRLLKQARLGKLSAEFCCICSLRMSDGIMSDQFLVICSNGHSFHGSCVSKMEEFMAYKIEALPCVICPPDPESLKRQRKGKNSLKSPKLDTPLMDIPEVKSIEFEDQYDSISKIYKVFSIMM